MYAFVSSAGGSLPAFYSLLAARVQLKVDTCGSMLRGNFKQPSTLTTYKRSSASLDNPQAICVSMVGMAYKARHHSVSPSVCSALFSFPDRPVSSISWYYSYVRQTAAWAGAGSHHRRRCPRENQPLSSWQKGT